MEQTEPGLLRNTAAQPRARLLLAHGAGAPMDSPFLDALAEALAERGISVLRFEFAYMAQRRHGGARRPPPKAEHLLAEFATLVNKVSAEPGPPLWLGGKSMGGRMATMLAQQLPVAGVVVFGYPFHPPGKPEKPRVAHLPLLTTPVLICQGDRDVFGKPEQVSGYELGAVALTWLQGGDHDFKPLKRSGLQQSELISEAAEAASNWISQHRRLMPDA